MNRFEGHHAVVTGVTSGIGLAVARRLLAEGANVTGLGRNERKLAVLRSELGRRFDFVVADLAAAAERERAATALGRTGHVDVFVSNAGEAAYASPLGIAPSDFRRLFELNVCAPLELCQAVVPVMPATGHVVQVSSVAARFMPNPKFGPYAVTKAAVAGLMDALRLEIAARGIRVTSIAPGLVDTPIYDDLTGFAELRQKLEEQVPNWLAPEDVAETVTWVLSLPPNVVVSELTVLPRGQAR